MKANFRTCSMLLLPLPLAPVTKLTLWFGSQVNWEWHMKLSMCTCERINFKMVKTYLKKLYLHLKDASMDIKKVIRS